MQENKTAPKEGKVIPLIEAQLWVWVAPDGNIQMMTFGEDIPMCLAITKMLHKAGLSKSTAQMKLDGFTLEKMSVTIKPALIEVDIPGEDLKKFDDA